MSTNTIDEALAYLRSHLLGDLRFDENGSSIRFVIASDGRLVAPVMVAMLQAVDTVLFVPSYQDNAMELQLTLTPFDENGRDGAHADRWRIYHGEPEDVRWAFLEIDAARFQTTVIDGAALTQSNPLADDEPRLCKELNSLSLEQRQHLCTTLGGGEVEDPRFVGVDPHGFDVRRRFDILRLIAPQPFDSANAVRSLIESASG